MGRASRGRASMALPQGGGRRNRRLSVEAVLFAHAMPQLEAQMSFEGTLSPDEDASPYPRRPFGAPLQSITDSAEEIAPAIAPAGSNIGDRHAAAVILQARLRGRKARAELARQHKAAVAVQANFRGHFARKAQVVEEEEAQLSPSGVQRDGTRTRRRRVALDAVPHASSSRLPAPPEFAEDDATSPAAGLEGVPHACGAGLPGMPSFRVSGRETSERDSGRDSGRSSHAGLPPMLEETGSALEAAMSEVSTRRRNAQTDEEKAILTIQARIRGRRARASVHQVRTKEEEKLRQTVLKGVATLPNESLKLISGLTDWANSAAPALALSVRTQRQQLVKRQNAEMAQQGLSVVAGSAAVIQTRPPDLSKRAHAWVERQVTLGLLSSRGGKEARQLVLAVRQVKIDGLSLPTPSKRRRRQHAERVAAEGGGFQGVADRAYRGIFGAMSPKEAGAGFGDQDTLALCVKLLDALLEVGMLHETNEWLQEQLAWKGPKRSRDAAAALARSESSEGPSSPVSSPSPRLPSASAAPAPPAATPPPLAAAAVGQPKGLTSEDSEEASMRI